jgi:hypothetical protein
MSPDSKAPQSGAERMRAYRRHRRRGFRCVEVQVGPAEVNGLVAKGYLPLDKRQDLHSMGLDAEIAMRKSVFKVAQPPKPKPPPPRPPRPPPPPPGS